MNRRTRATAVVTIVLLAGGAVGSAQEGRRQIEQLAGCFDVSYRFVEDGESDSFPGEAIEAREWIGLERTDEHTFLLQHLLFAGPQPVPHWHEVWTWHPAEETWTQEVRGGAPHPGSELRYRCTGSWVMNRWECHAGQSAKPLRDADRDYEWLDRRNILLVTPDGWVHNQHNAKMRSGEEIVAHELGWNVYRRLEDRACGAAVEQFPVNGGPR
jgi:hypothetical protein